MSPGVGGAKSAGDVVGPAPVWQVEEEPQESGSWGEGEMTGQVIASATPQNKKSNKTDGKEKRK